LRSGRALRNWSLARSRDLRADLTRQIRCELVRRSSRRVVERARLRSQTDKALPVEELHELLEAGQVTPVVDRTFPLSEVPEAIRYLRDGRAHARSSSPCEARPARLLPRRRP
jgi:NADPH:quinone reductase-like Zn-dependent oxidoreductase